MTLRETRPLVTGLLLVLVTATVVFQAQGRAQIPSDAAYISDGESLDGLAAGAVFPFVDSTPRHITKAHIALTDDTSDCTAGAAAPASVQVLVGEAGVALEPVMDATTNTGITTTPGQCVFHATVRAGKGGLPDELTDIVVLNGGQTALTGINTITVSATVR